MKRIYLAGPMSGLPDNNYPAFHAAAAELRALGVEVKNPAENPEPPCGGTWLGYMRLSLRQLADDVEAVALLPGWEQSRGARIEFQLATSLGLPALPLDEFLRRLS